MPAVEGRKQSKSGSVVQNESGSGCSSMHPKLGLLGARFHGMEEVIGSIPIRSTKFFQQLSGPADTHIFLHQPKVQPKIS